MESKTISVLKFIGGDDHQPCSPARFIFNAAIPTNIDLLARQTVIIAIKTMVVWTNYLEVSFLDIVTIQIGRWRRDTNSFV